MKKILCLVFTLLLFGTVIYAVAGSGRESTQLPPQEVKIMYSSEDHGYQQKDISDNIRFKTLPDGSIVTQDSSGTTDFFVPSDRVVYITRPSQLSTWTGQAATSGQSYYQMSPGKIYVVDPHAIATYGCAPGGTSAMGSSFSAVSMILPSAATYSGPAYDTKVIIGLTSSTGYVAPGISGSTNVQVWPYPGGTGLTAYNVGAAQYASTYRSACTPQWLLGEYVTSGTTSSVVGSVTAFSGNSYWELNKLSESATFGLYNGQVSAFVVDKKVWN